MDNQKSPAQSGTPEQEAVNSDHLKMVRIERLVSLILFLLFTALILLY